jgi:prepilin-type N-terminal cleavage/methylation domain-containing protein
MSGPFFHTWRPGAAKEERSGFTLIEIVAALAILGTALFVLLEAHLGAMRLCADAQDEVMVRSLLQQAVAQAEVEVQMGNTSGSGKFGKRYPGYSYAFQANPVGEDQTVLLFEVLVKVEGLAETRTMSVFVYDKRAQ